MRDKKRIKPILKRLERCWEKVPDWRLGQLLTNAWSGDMFFPEDKDLIDAVEKMIKQYEVKK